MKGIDLRLPSRPLPIMTTMFPSVCPCRSILPVATAVRAQTGLWVTVVYSAIFIPRPVIYFNSSTADWNQPARNFGIYNPSTRTSARCRITGICATLSRCW